MDKKKKKNGHSKKPRIKPLSKLQSDALKIFNTCMEEGKIFKSKNWDIMTQDTLLRGEGGSCEDTSVTRKF